MEAFVMLGKFFRVRDDEEEQSLARILSNHLPSISWSQRHLPYVFTVVAQTEMILNLQVISCTYGVCGGFHRVHRQHRLHSYPLTETNYSNNLR